MTMINGTGPNPAAMASQTAAMNAGNANSGAAAQNPAQAAQQPGATQTGQASPQASAAAGAQAAQAVDNPTAARGVEQATGNPETNSLAGATATGAVNGPEAGAATSASATAEARAEAGESTAAGITDDDAAVEDGGLSENDLAATVMPDGTMDNRGINTAGSTLDIQA